VIISWPVTTVTCTLFTSILSTYWFCYFSFILLLAAKFIILTTITTGAQDHVQWLLHGLSLKHARLSYASDMVSYRLFLLSTNKTPTLPLCHHHGCVPNCMVQFTEVSAQTCYKIAQTKLETGRIATPDDRSTHSRHAQSFNHVAPMFTPI